jgi:hypothetical protein
MDLHSMELRLLEVGVLLQRSMRIEIMRLKSRELEEAKHNSSSALIS